MSEENGTHLPSKWVGATLAAMTLMISLDIGFTAWLSVRWIETETTQNSVTTDIQFLKDGIVEQKRLLSEMYQQLQQLPSTIDDDDRWYRDLEYEYQKGVEDNHDMLQRQIDELKLHHPPYK